MSNFLYVVESQGYHKIGIAESMTHRLAGLQTGNPFRLNVYRVYQFDHPRAVETVLHDRFDKKRVLGEWFSLSNEDLSTIDYLCTLLGGIETSRDQWNIIEPDEGEIDEDSDKDSNYYDFVVQLISQNPSIGRDRIKRAANEAGLSGISTDRLARLIKDAKSSR